MEKDNFVDPRLKPSSSHSETDKDCEEDSCVSKNSLTDGPLPSPSRQESLSTEREMSNNLQDNNAGGDAEKSIPDLPQNRIRRGASETWQNSKFCLKERVSYLFNNDILSDVNFLVGRKQQRIPGHKFVLAIGSPVFDAMFNGPLGMKDSETCVELPDVEPQAFLALMKVIY